MTLIEQLETLKAILESSLEDAEKFERGNDSAGVRVRKTLQTVVNGCKDLRKTVQDTRESRKQEKSS